MLALNYFATKRSLSKKPTLYVKGFSFSKKLFGCVVGEMERKNCFKIVRAKSSASSLTLRKEWGTLRVAH